MKNGLENPINLLWSTKKEKEKKNYEKTFITVRSNRHTSPIHSVAVYKPTLRRAFIEVVGMSGIFTGG